LRGTYLQLQGDPKQFNATLEVYLEAVFGIISNFGPDGEVPNKPLLGWKLPAIMSDFTNQPSSQMPAYVADASKNRRFIFSSTRICLVDATPAPNGFLHTISLVPLPLDSRGICHFWIGKKPMDFGDCLGFMRSGAPTIDNLKEKTPYDTTHESFTYESIFAIVSTHGVYLSVKLSIRKCED